MSFPFQDKGQLKKLKKKSDIIFLGDIIINIKKLDSSSIKRFQNHLNILWIHGFLHLLGHNHKLDKEYCKMQKLENKFLNFVK